MQKQKQKLLLEQVDRKLSQLKPIEKVPVPQKGWIAAVRTALKMSLRQLGARLKISAQSVMEIEQREANGSITLRSLREAADALGMKLVYGVIPKEDSLETMIEKRARELAREIVGRTSATMQLEGQENTDKRIEKAIRSKAEEIKDQMPNYLWD